MVLSSFLHWRQRNFQYLPLNGIRRKIPTSGHHTTLTCHILRRVSKLLSTWLNFFVDKARRNLHSFPSRGEEEKSLIYNYLPFWTGGEEDDWVFQQVYVF